MNQKIFICEDSLDGIMTALHEALYSGIDREYLKICIGDEGNFTLFSEYIYVETDPEKAEKTAHMLRYRLGAEGYYGICHAAMSFEEDKADAILGMVMTGLSMKDGRMVMDHISDKAVGRVFELSRTVSNEAHHHLGFIRFRELKNRVLLSEITPKNDILTLVAPHFEDRLGCEDWMIYDRKRSLFAVHRRGSRWGIVTGETLDMDRAAELSEREEEFQDLWKRFCSSVSIRERENTELQQQNLPLRFRKNMTEFE